MPIAAAGISAAGGIVGSIAGGKGAKKAAKVQQQTAQMQIAANNANLAKITGLEQPTIDRGNAAGDTYANFLGLNGGTAAADGLATFRNSTGYQDLLKAGLGAVNSNAYARGLGDSGATMKALQAKGVALADQSSGQYLGNLNNLIQTGNSAIGNIAGVNTQTTQANNQATQTAADASSNAALYQSALLANTANGAANKLASSFGDSGSSSASGYGWGGWVNNGGLMPAYIGK